MKIGCYAFLVLTPLLLAAAPPTPQQYYAQALAVMRALPQPARVSMAATAVGRNIGVYVGPQKSEPKMATFVLGPGLASTASWTEHYDAASNTSLIDTKTAQSLSGARSIFDPTWYGAYDWLRYGFDGHRPASAQNAPSPDSQLKTIATLSVMAPGAYRISEGGAQQCPDGSPGHHLQMAARRDIDAHPLTDVTIDEHTMRICSFRFRIDKE
ncbi:MAG TPA: hypothetical protein VFN37_02075, partial [Candidatus Baltobacteraceae bacterium]|nr:hypothetical protein [Candidatus Baltobacteraceae bacterium]